MTFEEMHKRIEQLKIDALFGVKNAGEGTEPVGIEEGEGCLDLMAEQEFLQALAFLDAAMRAVAKANLLQTRGRADAQRRGLYR